MIASTTVDDEDDVGGKGLATYKKSFMDGGSTGSTCSLATYGANLRAKRFKLIRTSGIGAYGYIEEYLGDRRTLFRTNLPLTMIFN